MFIFRWIFRLLDLIVIDQISKFFSLVLIKDRIVLVDDFLALMLKKNQGIALGRLANLPELYQIYLRFFILFVLSLMGGYLVIFGNKMRFPSRIALFLMIAGGVSNQIDRFWHDGVIDMLEVSICGVNLFTCNLADIYITFGFILYLFTSYFDNDKKKKPDIKSNDHQGINGIQKNPQGTEVESRNNEGITNAEKVGGLGMMGMPFMKPETKYNEQQENHIAAKPESKLVEEDVKQKIEEIDLDELD